MVDLGSLVLGIRPGEYVQIGEDVKVCVVKAKGKLLRLKVIAPKSCTVLRSELIEKMQDELTQ